MVLVASEGVALVNALVQTLGPDEPVYVAHDLEHALSLLRKLGRFCNLVLVDLEMKSSDALGMIQRLRQQDPVVPIMAVGDSAGDAAADAAIGVGATDVLPALESAGWKYVIELHRKKSPLVSRSGA